MKSVLKGFFFLVLSAVPALAQSSDDGFYTRATVGRSYGAKSALKNGFYAQTGFGQRWAGMWRTEFTFEYMRTAMQGAGAYNKEVFNVKTHLKSFAAMGSVYADFFADKAVSPYLGIGAGVTRNDLPDAVADGRQVFGDSRFRLAWKAMAGLSVSLPKNLVLDIGYTYVDDGRFYTKKSFPPALRQDMKTRQAGIGLRYDF